MTTYATDAEIAARDPRATEINTASTSTDFSAVRAEAYAEIGRRLARRSPPIDQVSLGLVTDLKESEIRYALHRLYFVASSRSGDDTNWSKAQAYKRDFEDEIASVPLPVASTPSRGSCRIFRS